MPRKPGAAAAQLAVVRPSPTCDRPEPPRELGVHGRRLWDAVVEQYEFVDPASIEVLCLACQSIDRAEACTAEILKDGQMIRTKMGPRSHPLLRDELTNRAFAARSLAKLGLDLEPVRGGVGRPGGGGVGISMADLAKLRG